MAVRILETTIIGMAFLLARAPLTSAGTVEWSGEGGTNRWVDAANWKGGKEPGNGDVAKIGSIPPGGRIVLDQSRSIGRLEVELQSSHQRLLLDGHGQLLLTGVDTMPSKPVSLRVANGTLQIGPSLTIDVQGTRPQVSDPV